MKSFSFVEKAKKPPVFYASATIFDMALHIWSKVGRINFWRPSSGWFFKIQDVLETRHTGLVDLSCRFGFGVLKFPQNQLQSGTTHL